MQRGVGRSGRQAGRSGIRPTLPTGRWKRSGPSGAPLKLPGRPPPPPPWAPPSLHLQSATTLRGHQHCARGPAADPAVSQRGAVLTLTLEIWVTEREVAVSPAPRGSQLGGSLERRRRGDAIGLPRWALMLGLPARSPLCSGSQSRSPLETAGCAGGSHGGCSLQAAGRTRTHGSRLAEASAGQRREAPATPLSRPAEGLAEGRGRRPRSLGFASLQVYTRGSRRLQGLGSPPASLKPVAQRPQVSADPGPGWRRGREN